MVQGQNMFNHYSLRTIKINGKNVTRTVKAAIERRETKRSQVGEKCQSRLDGNDNKSQ